ncbi:MAG: RluA family pseudouridine synthase [Candidatus Electrothrix scaldis]|nr:MAG: RluA family pseudouridine synthase [Candidatus Electrothrix sp. GW3-3]
MPSARIPSHYHIQSRENGMRLDHFLALHFPEHSRSSLGKHIRSSHILVNEKTVKPGHRLHPDDVVLVDFPPRIDKDEPLAQPVDFSVLYEDESLVVINKPPGLVVHPAAGHADKTLVNGLLHRYADMASLEGGRPGIVHRLDKDTSGILLVARTEKVQALLSAAFKKRQVSKTYHALLLRTPEKQSGRIIAPIGRHPVQRKKMTIRSDGRYAASHWEILETFPNGICFAEIGIETGRTHQIRVHMSSLKAPVLGDALYGGKAENKLKITAERQLLHASILIFTHPVSGKECSFTAPLWPDMEQLLSQLRENSE